MRGGESVNTGVNASVTPARCLAIHRRGIGLIRPPHNEGSDISAVTMSYGRRK